MKAEELTPNDRFVRASMYSYLSFPYTSLNTCKEVRVIYTRFCNKVKVV